MPEWGERPHPLYPLVDSQVHPPQPVDPKPHRHHLLHLIIAAKARAGLTLQRDIAWRSAGTADDYHTDDGSLLLDDYAVSRVPLCLGPIGIDRIHLQPVKLPTVVLAVHHHVLIVEGVDILEGASGQLLFLLHPVGVRRYPLLTHRPLSFDQHCCLAAICTFTNPRPNPLLGTTSPCPPPLVVSRVGLWYTAW